VSPKVPVWDASHIGTIYAENAVRSVGDLEPLQSLAIQVAVTSTIVVAAIEHRDGNGPGSVIMTEDSRMTKRFLINLDSLDPRPDGS
jgi:hypothetical protein